MLADFISHILFNLEIGRKAFDGWWHRWHFTHYDRDGNPNVFSVNANDDGLWLNTNNGRPDNVWNPDNRFVFSRPRNSHPFTPAPLARACFVLGQV